jgi:F-type H+-transporting ATPase subunit b
MDRGGAGGRQIDKGWLGLALAIAAGFGSTATAWASGAGGHELPWADFAFRVLNFSILLAVLVKLLKKPLAGFFVSRRDGIEKLLAETEQKRQDAEEKCAAYKARLDVLEGETAKILAEYVREGEAEKQKIIEAAERQALYLKQQAQIAIQQEVKAAKKSLQTEIGELSVAAAEELLRKKIGSKDQQRLVRDFMTKVVEAK